MHLSRLSLTNFRNYESLDLPLATGITLFSGENAQGKTNLLEAAYLLATLRSPRTDSDADLVSWATAGGEAGACRIAGRVEREPIRVDLEVQLIGRRDQPPPADVPVPVPYASRRIRVNGMPKRAIDATGILNAVFFSTLDIDLITGSPSVRRRYLDLTLTQVDPAYRRHLNEYGKVMSQRNALLKRIHERRSDATELDFWDGQLIDHGGHILASRATAVREIDRLAAEEEAELTGGAEVLALAYEPRVSGAGAVILSSPHAARIALRAALEAGRDRDIDSGMSLQGPHRDDLTLLIGGVSAASFASRAQQRTAALALRLAEARFLESQTGEAPVLLLDDILSEMDNRRRASVLGRLDNARQLLITTAEPDVFPPDFTARTTHLRVHRGALTPA